LFLLSNQSVNMNNLQKNITVPQH